MMDSEPRTTRLVVRPRNRRATPLIQEGDACVNYAGGETADVSEEEACRKLATFNFDLVSGEVLTTQQQRFLEALTDPLWPAKHGRYPTFEEFA